MEIADLKRMLSYETWKNKLTVNGTKTSRGIPILLYPSNVPCLNEPCELSNAPCLNEPCELSNVPCLMNPVSSQMHPAPVNPVSSPMYPVRCCGGNASRPHLQLACAGSRLAVHTTQHTSLSLSGFIQLRVEMQVSAGIKTKHLHGMHVITLISFLQ